MSTSVYPRVAFAVRLDAALRVRPFASKELTRYYLNGVYVDASASGGAICVATDGHRLGIRYARDGVCYEPAIVALPAEVKMPKGMLAAPWLICTLTAPGKGYVSIVEAATAKDAEDTAEAAIARAEDCTLRVGRSVIDGNFPDWRRVVPTAQEGDVIRAFNGKLVDSFGKYVTLRGHDESAPHLVEVADDRDFIGVIMPMRPNGKLDKSPEWLAAPARPAAKKAA